METIYTNISCKKTTPYDEKVKMFKENISFTLIGSIHSNQFTESDFNDVFKLIENENILIPPLPIFRYNNKVMCMSQPDIKVHVDDSTRLISGYEYKTSTVDEIINYLDEGFLVFLYNILDKKYGEDEKIIYRYNILKE